MTDRSTQQRSGGIQVIARASRIMQALSNHQSGLSLNALAQIVDLPRSTVQRILGALEQEGMVEPIRPGTGYRLGHAFSMMVRQSFDNIIATIRGSLVELGGKIQETVALSTIQGQKTNVIDRIVAEKELCVHFPWGSSLPAHSTSDGKILLSTLSNDQIRQLVGDDPQKKTENTLGLEQLLNQMDSIRNSGIAEDHEEHTLGISAASVLISTGLDHYALSIIAPSVRFNKRRDEFLQALMHSRESVMQKIG